LARAEFDRGAVDDGLAMTRILLLLKRSDAQETALRQFMEQQQDKSSPNYHVWLTPQDFGAQYGPADADITAVTQWLTSEGFRIEKVYSGKTVIEFSGTAGQVRTAFGTAIHSYEVDGKLYSANVIDPQVPAALAPVVAGIVSLNSFPRQSYIRVAGAARKIAGKPGLEPLFTFPISNVTFYGMAPGDFATIYNSKSLISSGNDGTGQTIAIVGETNINLSDVQAFRQMFGLPANFISSNIILNGEDPGITSTGEEGEADLDVEWSGAVAPGATVYFVVSASTPASQGIDLSALYIIEHNLAGVMSESYGNCESALGTAGNAFYNALWEQAAAQGITAMVSSGDGGSAGCDNFDSPTPATHGLAVSGLASTPYNVAVGGTDFDDRNQWSTYWSTTNATTGTDVIGTSALSYIPEIPWSENCAQLGLSGCVGNPPSGSVNIVAGSGGPSSCSTSTAGGTCTSGYGKPKWQMGVTGMPNDSLRDLPDVSLFASPGFDGTGYVYCQSDSTLSGARLCDITNPAYLEFGIVGGTSASSPAFAGVMALVNQYQGLHGGTNRQGNANYVLYQLVKKPAASCTSTANEAAGCIFNDVTHGNSYIATEYGSSVGTNSVPCSSGSPNCSVVAVGNAGVLVEESSPTTEAWTVTSGYDLVTGLGSVNINNLATNWGTVSTIPTKTTLALSPSTGITHGTNEKVAVNITVSPNSGTATGDVSLIATFADGTTQGLDQFTLGANGSLSGTTNSLPGGTNYSVTAHYAGDGTNAPSDSNAVALTVSPETSQTFIVVPTFDNKGNLLNGNATSVPYGSNYFIRMYVTNSAAVATTTGAPSGTCDTINLLTCPTGTVTLTDNGTALGTGGGGAGVYNLNGAGYTRYLSPNLLGGTQTLVASYSGDNSYQKNTGTATLTVTPAATQTSPPSSINSVGLGTGFWIDATVTGSVSVSNAAPPTGTVTFYDGNVVLPGTVSLTSSPGEIDALLWTSFSTAGPQSVTAQYSGDSNYAPSTSAAITVDSLNPVTITQSESSNNINYGDSITVKAVLTTQSKGPAMTGQVNWSGAYATFTNVTTTPGTDANGYQMLTATATASLQGTDYIYASYGGDTYYTSATSSPGDRITVNIPDFSFSIPNGGLTITAGQPGTMTFNVVPASKSSSSVALTCSGTAPGGYTYNLQPTSVTLTNGASAPATLTLTPALSTSGATGSAIRRKHSVILLAPRWPNPLLPLGVLGGVAVLLILGLATNRTYLRALAALSLVLGISLFVGCGGGGGGSGGGGGGGGVNATTTTVTTSAAKVAQGVQVTFTAKVSGSGNPTGLVDFYLSGSSLGQGVLSGGIATLTTSIAMPGIYTVAAAYDGDAQNNASTSPTINQTVTGSTQLQIFGQTGILYESTSVTVTVQ
jgi:hypothetical protein